MKLILEEKHSCSGQTVQAVNDRYAVGSHTHSMWYHSS